MTFEEALISVVQPPKKYDEGPFKIPIEKIVDGEVVTVSTKTIPIIPQKE